MKRQPPNWRTQYALDYQGEINVDLFAGGGGASTGLEMGLKRPVHIAINHDPDAISMHTANHPGAEHYQCVRSRSAHCHARTPRGPSAHEP